MARFIDADKIPYITTYQGTEYAQKTDIDLMPTADVEQVRHGEWLDWEYDFDDIAYERSRCHTFFSLLEGTPWGNDYNYCPNCGARMNGGKE